ncbi:MAG: hypothetical protein AAF927_29430 [Bacteroidota bacterium]
MKNSLELRPRLALGFRWVSGLLGLAMIIAGGVYMMQDLQVVEVQVNWDENIRLGEAVKLEIEIHKLDLDYEAITDFYLHLPAELEASFIPSSLQLLAGSLEASTVHAYSGKKRLLIEDLRSDTLRLEVMVQISEDLAFAERSYPFAYGVKVNQRVFPQHTAKDQFRLSLSPFQLTHRLLNTPATARKTARYEIILKNPTDGAEYNQANGLLSLMAIANHPDAKIKRFSLNGVEQDLPEELSNTLQIEDLKLSSGRSILVHYEVAFPAGVQKQNLLTTATAFVPASSIRQAAPVVIEPKAVDWGKLSLADSADRLDIAWSTQGELNNKGFWIERSKDGHSFESIGFVEGQGTSDAAKQYQYRINSLAAGCYYFRLRQESLSGMTQYSETKPYSHQVEEGYAMQFWENQQKAQLELFAPQKLRIEIRNKLGATVAVVFDGLMEAGVPYTLDLAMSEFSEGDYLFWMEGEYFKSRRLFIRRRGKWRHFG